MKIAQLCPYDINRPGGIQHHIRDLSQELVEIGHEVTIIAPNLDDRCKIPHAENGRIGVCPIAYVGSGRLINFNKTQIEITIALGSNASRLEQLMETFDVVHFHTLVSPFLPYQALRRSRRANVASFHNVPPDGRTGAIQRYLQRAFIDRLMCRLDGIILASEVQQDLRLIRGAAAFPVIPPCTNLRRFAASVEPLRRYDDNRLNILFFGRLEQRKGALVLLLAYLELCQRGLPVRLLLAGDGPERRNLEQLAKARAIPNVVFLGAIADVDIPRLYASCDIFCAPSLYGEGFGIVIVEAMASGKPIVAAANSGYRGLLHGDAAGFLVPPGDVEGTARRLAALVANSDLRHCLGDWGRQEAMQYDSAKLCPQFVAIYKKAIQSKTARDELHKSRSRLFGIRKTSPRL